jgi:hypothetical protein
MEKALKLEEIHPYIKSQLDLPDDILSPLTEIIQRTRSGSLTIGNFTDIYWAYHDKHERYHILIRLKGDMY